MGYSTTRIETDVAKMLAVGGEVVSASKEKYFNASSDWKDLVGMAELKDDNRTIFFGLAIGCFVEYKLAKPLSEEMANDIYTRALNNHYNYSY